jgi:hypothetical protein
VLQILFISNSSRKRSNANQKSPSAAITPNGGSNIMPYELELEREQEQRLEQSIIAAEHLENLNDSLYQAFVTNRGLGTGKLCPCGLKCAEDCDCPF